MLLTFQCATIHNELVHITSMLKLVSTRILHSVARARDRVVAGFQNAQRWNAPTPRQRSHGFCKLLFSPSEAGLIFVKEKVVSFRSARLDSWSAIKIVNLCSELFFFPFSNATNARAHRILSGNSLPNQLPVCLK